MKQIAFGVVVVAVVCAVFVLSQPKSSEAAKSETSTQVPTQELSESSAQDSEGLKQASEESKQTLTQEVDSDKSQESQSSSESHSKSSVKPNPAAPEHSSNMDLDSVSKPAHNPTQNLAQDLSPKTFIVCAENVAVYERSGQSLIGSAFRGLVGVEVGRVDDKIVLQVRGYHKGAQVLYGDFAFGAPALELHGVDAQISLEVAIGQKDLSQACEVQGASPTQSSESNESRESNESAPTPHPNKPQSPKAQSYGNI